MPLPRFPVGFALLALLTLAACGGPPARDLGLAAPLECAPFARALSGIALRGDAPTWWWAAAGRYQRGSTPEVGAAMLFAPTGRLPRGHVSVVSRVLSRREILVTHANWLHHRVLMDQLVVDESTRGDWSVARVWWPPSGALGATDYPVLGFIYAPWRASHDGIVGGVPRAIDIALEE